MPDTKQMKIRVPQDCKTFLSAEAIRNASSQTSEIVRSIRERMDRQKAERPDALTSDRS